MPVGASGLRGCAISPDGAFLDIAAAGGDEVSVWRIEENGGPSATWDLRTPTPGAIAVGS